MIVDDLKPGQIFFTDNTLTYPNLKLHKGFISMRSQYIYLCKGDDLAWLITEVQIKRVANNFRMSREEFDKYKRELIKKYDVPEV